MAARSCILGRRRDTDAAQHDAAADRRPKRRRRLSVKDVRPSISCGCMITAQRSRVAKGRAYVLKTSMLEQALDAARIEADVQLIR